MKKNHLITASFVIVSSVLSFSLIAKADDDHGHEKREYYNYHEQNEFEDYEREEHGYKHYEDDDEDYEDEEEYEEYEGNYYYEQQQPPVNITKELWYKWSRSAAEPTETAALPISQASEISLMINNEEPIQISVIPDVSQLLVPVEEVAKYLGATTIVYPNSEIIEIKKDNMHLIVRNNTKVVYENMKKTPMQSAVIKKDDTYYMPISVLANGLGYQINETVTNNQIQLERIAQL